METDGLGKGRVERELERASDEARVKASDGIPDVPGVSVVCAGDRCGSSERGPGTLLASSF